MTYPGSFRKLSSHGTNAAPENGQWGGRLEVAQGLNPADFKTYVAPDIWFHLSEVHIQVVCACSQRCWIYAWMDDGEVAVEASILEGPAKRTLPRHTHTHTVDLRLQISNIMVSSPMRTVKRGLDVSPILAWLWLKLWSRDSLLMFWRFFKQKKEVSAWCLR